MKTINIIKKIIKSCDIIFAESWSKERTQLIQIFNDHETSKAFDFWAEQFNVHRTSNLSASQRSRYYDLRAFVDFAKRFGLDSELLKRRDKHFQALTAKIHFNLVKYLDDKFDDVTDIEISMSPKGFVIVATLWSDGLKVNKIRTSCVPAGGHNIQIFHFRYLTKIMTLQFHC